LSRRKSTPNATEKPDMMKERMGNLAKRDEVLEEGGGDRHLRRRKKARDSRKTSSVVNGGEKGFPNSSEGKDHFPVRTKGPKEKKCTSKGGP